MKALNNFLLLLLEVEGEDGKAWHCLELAQVFLLESFVDETVHEEAYGLVLQVLCLALEELLSISSHLTAVSLFCALGCRC